MKEASLQKVLRGTELTAFTQHTQVPEPQLLLDLAKTRRRGWSLDREERYEGMSCIGAAIYNDRGEPCAGISVSGPSVRFDETRAPELADLVKKAAAEITFLSGGRTPDHSDLSDG